MFGYRYDTETGLYYLQSRYYNPEWGRFINADGIVGQIGALLSHNVFAYCQNNFVTMSDPSGFMMVCITDDVSGVSNNISINKSTSNSRGTRGSSNIIPNKNQATCVARNALITGIEGGVSSVLSEIPDAIPFVVNRAARRAGQYFSIPIKGASTARAIGKIEKVGVITAVFAGISVWDNYHSGYNESEAFGRSVIDVGISIAVIAIGWSNPVGWAVFAGLALGTAGEVAKNYIWKKE